MFLKDYVRRKIATLLQPWLRNDDELQLKLGFLRSHGFLNNISLNTFALNKLLDDPSKFCFKEVTVGHLSLEFAPFSSVAFTLVVRGLRVVLSLGEGVDELGEKWKRNRRDTTLDERNKLLQEIDPEGCALHGVIKKISELTTRTWSASFLNSVIRHCCLQLHDAYVHLQSPHFQEPLSCSLYMKKVGAASRISQKCFFRGLICSIFMHSEKSSFEVDANLFEITSNSENGTSCICSLASMVALVNLNHLQSISFNIQVPALNLLFSPKDFSVLLLLYGIFCKGHKHARSGRSLWNLVAAKIICLLPNSKLSVVRTVRIVCLWMRYINTYRDLLVQVGYPADDVMKRSILLMFQDKMYSGYVRSQWNLVSEVENCLPLEAVAMARRIVRSRVASSAPGRNENFQEMLYTSPIANFFSLLLNIFSWIGALLVSLMNIVLLHKVLATFSGGSPYIDSGSESSILQQSFSLEVQEILLCISPDNLTNPSVSGHSVSFAQISNKKLLSFHFLIDGFLARQVMSISEWSFKFASGQFKVFPSSSPKVGASSFSEWHSKKEPNQRQIIVSGQPAKHVYLAESSIGIIGTSAPHLERLLEKLWDNWDGSNLESKGENATVIQDSWILCEVQRVLSDVGHGGDSRSNCNYSLIVGKLNFSVEYYSLAAAAVILRQTQSSLYWSQRRINNVASLASAIVIGNPPVKFSSSTLESISSKIELGIVRSLPEKHFEIVAFIAGPQIIITLSNHQFPDEAKYPYNIDARFTFEMCNLEILASPVLEVDAGLLNENCPQHDREPGCRLVKGPQEIDYYPESKGSYSCQRQTSFNICLIFGGLNAYVEQRSSNKKHQIMMLQPIKAHLRVVRKVHHSFGSSIVTVLANYHCAALEFSCILFLDELYALVKIIFGVLNESHAFPIGGAGGGLSYKEVSCNEAGKCEPEHGQNLCVEIKQVRPVISTQVILDGSFTVKSFDVLLHSSRKRSSVETFMGTRPSERGAGSALHETSENGIYISIQPSVVDFMFKGKNIDTIVHTHGVRCAIFRYLIDSGTFERFDLNNVLDYVNLLAEASVCYCKLSLQSRDLRRKVQSPSVLGGLDEASSSETISCKLIDSPLIVDHERIWDHWLSGNMIVSRICIAGYNIKDSLDNEFEDFSSSFSVGGEFLEVSYESKGGSILLEATAAMMLMDCFSSYYKRIREWPSSQSSRRTVAVKYDRELSNLDGHPGSNSQQFQFQELIWEFVRVFSLSFLNLSLVLLDRDESGRIQELQLEVNFDCTHELLSTVKKISVNISKLSMLSQSMQVDARHDESAARTSVSPGICCDPSTSFISEDPSPSSLQHKKSVEADPFDFPEESTICQRLSHAGTSTSNPRQRRPHKGPRHYVLKELRFSLEVEGPIAGDPMSFSHLNGNWVGGGSISGFELTISLDEIKMILSAFEAFSKVLNKEKASKANSGELSYNQVPEENMAGIVPDGAIVALQDVDQHMYVAVEGEESGHGIVGAIHYSLVGEQALFRIQYHKTRMWEPDVLFFSLISLCAKDKSGQSLGLSCQTKSRFVDVSCASDNASALWRIIPVKSDAYGNMVEREYCTSLSKGSFHLVNKKNDCALAFANGMLEFVSKPGNLFKWKVFDGPCLPDSLLLNRLTIEGNSIPGPESGELRASPRTGKHLKMNGMNLGILVIVDKVTLTVVHELSGTKERFPLLQGSIMPNQIIVQAPNSKIRVMNLFEVVLCYFDGQRNSWKEFMQPIEICTFYSQKFVVLVAENSFRGTPEHFYARTGEVCLLLTELSMDILLFVIGKLDLAGPYAVKSSTILTNCCKVNNHSGLTLVCSFYGDQEASILARKSLIVFLRDMNLANQPPEASLFSLKYVNQGLLSTLPIRLSLLEAGQFAWRTRIVSLKDSKSYPGPFIAIEISKGVEDGLSINVSPLLKIHNETDFSLELRFQRPKHEEIESALLMLRAGEVIDDAMTAFTAIDMSGGLRKALTSLTLGNYVFSFRPDIQEGEKNLNLSVGWSDDLKGGKPVRLSGLFEKLTYQMRKALSINSMKFSLHTANCALKSEDGYVIDLYFLVQTVRKSVPVVNPENTGRSQAGGSLPVAMQEQKEIFVLPTIQVSNLLHTEVHVSLTDRDQRGRTDCNNPWSQATISYGSTVKFYANPDTIYFAVTLTSFGLSCKPANSVDWVRKLQKKKGDIPHLDVELDFGGEKYIAMLRLSRGTKGTLKAVIFTTYALQNNTNNPLLCISAKQRPLSRLDMERFGANIPLEFGLYLPPNSMMSWFLKSCNLQFKLLEDKILEAELDLDHLSGLTQIDLETKESFGSKDTIRLGVSLRPLLEKNVPSQIVSLSPRYILYNESEMEIAIRQCHVEDMEELSRIGSNQRMALRLKKVQMSEKGSNVIDHLLRKHTKPRDNLSFFIQFRPVETGQGWSGPVCVASLGRFFLRFRKSSGISEGQLDTVCNNNLGGFAAVHAMEEGSNIILRFHWPPLTDLPYRIENYLCGAPITYYQKGSYEPDTLGAGTSVNYVWDDLTLPHKLVVQIDDVHLLHEINLDKIRPWKPFHRNQQNRGLVSYMHLDKKPEDENKMTYSQLMGSETAKLGFEVYAEGVTRVLRICEFSRSRKLNIVPGSGRKLRLRISYFSIHLQHAKDVGEESEYGPIIIARFERINWDAVFINQRKYNKIGLQSLSVDEKWVGAPFAAMLRQHRSEKTDADDCILRLAFVLLPMSAGVKQVKYLSIVLQPIDLNIDEETLMKIVPFWRRSLSDSRTPRQQYYFDHFEIHPIKIVASFLPGDSQYRYSSTQETLRSLLHSVIKVPAIKRKTVELNGVLVTHALITLRELAVKCAQHYSWYAMRAIYIAKGSPLLPPDFASLFDDLASSSLDVFFDPSSGLLNLPGMTLGTLKLVSKFIDNEGFSGTKRYFGDLGKTLRTAGSHILFAAVTEVSDSVLKGAEASGFNGLVTGFHHGILKLAMEPSVLSSAFMGGGPDRKIKLDRSPGVDELYIEGYLQAMLDTMYKQEYLRVRVVEDQVILKNLPPSTTLIDEIMEHVKAFLASKALLKGGSSMAHSLRHIRGEREWRIGPTILALCEHLFVSFVIRFLRKQSGKATKRINWKEKERAEEERAIVPVGHQKLKLVLNWGIGKFLFSGLLAYVDGRLCRNIPHPLARRIVSGFLLSFLDQRDDENKVT